MFNASFPCVFAVKEEDCTDGADSKSCLDFKVLRITSDVGEENVKLLNLEKPLKGHKALKNGRRKLTAGPVTPVMVNMSEFSREKYTI